MPCLPPMSKYILHALSKIPEVILICSMDKVKCNICGLCSVAGGRHGSSGRVCTIHSVCLLTFEFCMSTTVSSDLFPTPRLNVVICFPSESILILLTVSIIQWLRFI